MANDTTSKGSRDAWITAAYQALIEQGVDAVRIAPLSKRLKLARTSFYWFFEDRETLLQALLDQWKKNTDALTNRADAYAETIVEAVLNVNDCWLDPRLFDAQLEFAVRSWALQSPEVAALIEAADATRMESLRQMFLRFGYDATAADVRSRTIYLVQIGYISMNTVEDVETRMRRIPQYVEAFTGKIPEPRDIDRFKSRHGLLDKGEPQ
ncbi:TetR/AcrR family transcriptional regulator [Paracoccus caeni]|uniref:TetR/AcrR family transcriptional regulator n=1 Tax=Paracoccus caeni TaxID=657651 RepID=A0A934W1G7_9RHOB|nr:TetR/AcrR family transcriptional regulator [Paracoccus caeni]MBK4218010.1 TetR/AcrR family transcriptional regulator [Paracoccus caeni]